MAAKDIQMEDAELDALMAELDAETSGMVAKPTAKATTPVVVEPDPEDAGALVEALSKVIDTAEANDTAEAKRVAEQAAIDAAEMAQLLADQKAKNAAQLAAANKAAMEAQAAQNAAAEAAMAENNEKLALAAKLKAIGAAQEAADAAKAASNKAYAEPVKATAASEPSGETKPDAAPKKQAAPLRHHIDVDTFKSDVAINDTNLDKCMMEQAGLRAYHAAEAARAEGQHLRTKAQFERAEARLYDKHRRALLDAGEKITEKMVDNAVKMDDDWLRIKNAVIEAGTIADIQRSCAESLRDRGMMLVQMASDRREEGKGQSRVMELDESRKGLAARALAAVTK